MPAQSKQAPVQVAALQLHITLNDIEPPIWRHLWVENTLTLGRLHEVLQITMGWQNQPLHEFIRGECGAGILSTHHRVMAGLRIWSSRPINAMKPE